MSELLGTTWWSVLCVVAGFGIAIWLWPMIRRWIADR